MNVEQEEQKKFIEFKYQNLFNCMTKIDDLYSKFNDGGYNINYNYNKLLYDMFNLINHDWEREGQININDEDVALFNIEDSKPILIGAENRGIYRGYKGDDMYIIEHKTKTRLNERGEKYTETFTDKQRNDAVESCLVESTKQKRFVFGDIHGDIFPIIEVLTSNGITTLDLINCEIIFLGDVYDPFNNEFIIRDKDDGDLTYADNGGTIWCDFRGDNMFNKKLQYFATNDMYLSIIFIMFLAYKEATVYWILGNHDINSCALNPFFYALMRLIKNDHINYDGLNDDDLINEYKAMIGKIQRNLFICEKMFYKFKDTIAGEEPREKKIFFKHESSNVYDISNNLCDCKDRVTKEFKTDPASLYYMTFTTDIKTDDDNAAPALAPPPAALAPAALAAAVANGVVVGNAAAVAVAADVVGDTNCKRTSFSTYKSAIVVDGNTKTNVILHPLVNVWDLSVYGHLYQFHTEFFNLSDNSIIDNTIDVVIEKNGISLDHTTSLYKSTAAVCKADVISVIETDKLGYYESVDSNGNEITEKKTILERLKYIINSKNLN